MRLAIALALFAAALAAVPAHAATQYRGAQLIPLRGDVPMSGLKKELDLAKKAKLNLVKVDISWANLEPAQGAYSEEYLDQIDAFTRAAAQRKLKVLLLLQTTPCWTDTDPLGQCPTGLDGSDYPPADYDAYGNAAALLADRFGSRVAAIEIWNEPDHVNEEYWRGEDKAFKYAELVKATYSKVKGANSKVQVLAGSMVGASGEFLQELYDQGIKGYYDGLAVHYYENALASLRSIHDTQKKNGDKKPLWMTEFGIASCYPAMREEGGRTCTTRKEQGKFLVDIFQAINRTSWIRGAVIYNMRDDEQYKFGLASPTYEPKPALAALTKALGAKKLADPRKLKVKESKRGITVSAPIGDVLKLQAYKGPCSKQTSSSRPKHEIFDAKVKRGKASWNISALKRGKWCIYAEHYWVAAFWKHKKGTVLADLT